MHLAQMNIGTMVAPKGDPRVQPFFDALDEINALAEASPGFVWRMTDDSGRNATGITYSADPITEGLAKLWHLDRFGPTPLAFTFKQRFPPEAEGRLCVGWE
jgi:hypothetical protein